MSLARVAKASSTTWAGAKARVGGLDPAVEGKK